MVEFLLFNAGVDEAAEKLFEDAVRRFIENISQPPFGISGRMIKPDSNLLGSIHEACDQERDIVAVSNRIVDLFAFTPPWIGARLPKLVIACQCQSRLAELVRENNPLAEWGGRIDVVSIVYHFEPSLIWHEMFHLLGAGDCYSEGSDGGIGQDHACGHMKCVMQYAPCIARVGDPPFLCEGNVEKILQYWKPT